MNPQVDDAGRALRANILRQAPAWTVAEVPLPAMEGTIEADDLTLRAEANDRLHYVLRDPIDWRRRGAEDPPLDQGRSKACTSFAIAAALGDLYAIRRRRARIYSPGFIHSCVGRLGPDTPYSPATALRDLAGRRIALAHDAGFPCDAAGCAADVHDALKDWSPVTTESAAKSALRDGPIVTIMDNYEDFWRLYQGGAPYTHKGGAGLGIHTIELTGFDDRQNCWFVKNSRGRSWGDGGFGAIAYGQCQIFTNGGWGGYRLNV